MNQKEIIKKLSSYKKESEYHKKIKQIGLFGSFAKNNYTNQSDIDVFVKLKPAEMFTLIGIKNDLEKLFQRKIDIVALRQNMNKVLLNEIKQNGIYA
ncbi:MAG: nucleotidyltransferase domain-containing protein [Melioribacteraceae bacterium]|jgi:predicted nucleotidyltransferase|nr:nucleotidyltransferase domain-containing protein [Melioribacteraceae bacterium]